jgi:hypothetical protein
MHIFTDLNYIVARSWWLYIRRVLDWQLDLLEHTQLHTVTVYTLLQLTTVHYNTCRVSSLTLLYSEDSLSATH